MVHTFVSISCLVGFAQCALASSDTPLQKVIVMLGDMRVKSEKAAADERKIYAQYSDFVNDESNRLVFEVKEGKKNIDRFGALLAKAENDADNLGRRVQETQEDIERMQNSMQDANDMRQEEKSGYHRVSNDYGQSMRALNHAIETLKSQTLDHPQAAMLLQKLAADVPSVKDATTGFALESVGDDRHLSAKSAAGVFESDGLLMVLEKLQDKFTEELHETSEEEESRVHNYDVVVLHLRNGLKESNGVLAQKIAGKAKAVTDTAALRGKRAAALHELGANEKFLAETKAAYDTKSVAFAKNQQLRSEEVKVLKIVMDIISSPSVADSYKTPSFLQIRSSKAKDVRAETVAVFLQRQGAALSSSSLSSLAARIMRNPFFKVIHLLEALLSQMHLESQQEAVHKAWCDEQLHATKQKSQRRATQAKQLSAEMDELQSQIDEMAKAIQELTKEQSQLIKAMEAATNVRLKEKAENEAAILDAQAGDIAVKQALVVLEEFYSVQAASFVQLQPQDVEDNYASHRLYMSTGGAHSSGAGGSVGGFSGDSSGGSSGSASGKSSGGSFGGNSVGASLASDGVISMLEVVAGDFVRVAADTTTAEHRASAQYDAFMRDAKEDSEAKHALEVKTKLDKDQAEFEKTQSEDDSDSTSEELAKAKDYIDELLSQCVHSKVNFKQRGAARDAEIKALKEAYKMLDDHSVE